MWYPAAKVRETLRVKRSHVRSRSNEDGTFSEPKRLTRQQLWGKVTTKYSTAGLGVSELTGPAPCPRPGEGIRGCACGRALLSAEGAHAAGGTQRHSSHTGCCKWCPRTRRPRRRVGAHLQASRRVPAKPQRNPESHWQRAGAIGRVLIPSALSPRHPAHGNAESSRGLLHAFSTRPASGWLALPGDRPRFQRAAWAQVGAQGTAGNRWSKGAEGLGGCSCVLGTVTSTLGPLAPKHHSGVQVYRDKL